jgi:hypothetical protein
MLKAPYGLYIMARDGFVIRQPSKIYLLRDDQEDGSNCSIFSFEINDSTRSRLPLAKNAARKLRTLRHPGVVKVLDSVEVRFSAGVLWGKRDADGRGEAVGRQIATSTLQRSA